MLRLKHIKKSYKTGDFIQVALNQASITFRDNEFAAILGPSGSGKTTMLNIIGGLDKYDSGDLEIENISTKKYKDSDWDTYRNNRIGFVFQSYNLIPHQTIQANVELALTLSGVSMATRKVKARKALEKVGLGEHRHKLPNQLSGGQMQRVAIARALINDPEILLADEPTGALDTTTSTQVMDLLTEIAKDRLVIMVTHNSELAKKYANRIVHLRDGKIVSDSKPFDSRQEEIRQDKKIRKTRMSFATALSLSFSNLMTKKWRTLVTALAGSIGIIGIAAILSLANGIDAYIRNIEEETLSLYPLAIQSTGFDLGAMFEGMGGGSSEPPREGTEGLIRERPVLTNMFSLVNHNDLESLKVYFESNRQTLDPLVNSIHYMYNITPLIFLADISGGAVQVNPDPIFDAIGMGGGDGGMGMGFMGGFRANVFHEMPAEIEMFEHQYDLVIGDWPQSFDEVVLVLSHRGRISDLELYAMGLRDRDELEELVESLIHETVIEVEVAEELEYFDPETLMAVEFVVINPFERYEYDETFNVWVDRSGDQSFMTNLVRNGLPLRISGIVRPAERATSTALSNGINFTPSLIHHLMEEAAHASIVQEQLRNREVNVLTGRTFAEEQDEVGGDFDFSRIISVDEEALEEIFSLNLEGMDFEFDFSEMDLDLSHMNMDFSNLNIDPNILNNINLNIDGIPLPDIDIFEITDILAGQINIPTEVLDGLIMEIMQDFFLEIIAGGITDPVDILIAMEEYFSRPEIQAEIAAALSQIVVESGVGEQIMELLQMYIQEGIQAYVGQLVGMLQIQIQHQMEQVMTQVIGELARQLEAQVWSLMGGLEEAMEGMGEEIGSQIEEAMGQLGEELEGIDPEAFGEVFRIEMDEEELFQLMTSMMQPTENSYERNLLLLGYANKNVPSQINIYPRNFDSKQEIVTILDAYNQRMEENNQQDKVITYTDLVGAMMSSVTEIIAMVSYALIAFIAISLVVSSIMIGVITYISVLERKKEIGILRAIGASKRNIRQVFNAETLIVGFVAGGLGVLITLLIAEIANVIVYNRFDIYRIARLPLTAAIVLIITSMFLTYIAGLMPSSAAARKDPIEALRSE